MLTRVLNGPAAQRTAAALLGSYLRFAISSTRWTLDGATHLEPFLADVPVVVAFWHECLPLMPALWQHVRRRNNKRIARVLVSRHRDGTFIAAILARFGLGLVRGSTDKRPGKQARDRGGAAGLRALLRQLNGGEAVVITPDGPSGPARHAAPGVARLTTLSGAPLLPVAARMRRRIVLKKSWDQMNVPLPWGSGVLVCLPALAGPDDAAVEAALTAAAMRAEALCR